MNKKLWLLVLAGIVLVTACSAQEVQRSGTLRMKVNTAEEFIITKANTPVVVFSPRNNTTITVEYETEGINWQWVGENLVVYLDKDTDAGIFYIVVTNCPKKGCPEIPWQTSTRP